MASFEVEGFSGVVLVVAQDRVLLHKGYGFADIEERIRHDTSSLFPMASITKTFAAAAILKLQEQGKLRVTDRLSAFFGNVPEEKSTATVHHLATHTAGLAVRGTPIIYDRGREAFVRSTLDAPIESAPGAAYRYTNVGYGMLASIVEVVSGESFESYLRRQIFEPARLSAVHFEGETPTGERFAQGYRLEGDRRIVQPDETYDWGSRGASGLVTTVGDLYRWHRALRDGLVLSPESLAVMFHPWPEEGYGWHVEGPGDFGLVIHKGGGIPAFATQILYYPGPNVFVAWAANDLSRPWRQRLNAALSRVALCGAPPLSGGDVCQAPPSTRQGT